MDKDNNSTRHNNNGGEGGHLGGGGNKVIRPPSTTWGYTVLDPGNKVNPMLSVDAAFVHPTRAQRSYIEDSSRSDANFRMHHKVCTKIATPEGCCSGEGCRHIHVSPDYLKATRCVPDPLCCAEHNCYFSRNLIYHENCLRPELQIAVVSRGNPLGSISVGKISVTLAAKRHGGNALHATMDFDKDLCRLFQQGKCRWGKECSHIHICRVEYAKLLGRTTPSVTRCPNLTFKRDAATLEEDYRTTRSENISLGSTTTSITENTLFSHGQSLARPPPYVSEEILHAAAAAAPKKAAETDPNAISPLAQTTPSPSKLCWSPTLGPTVAPVQTWMPAVSLSATLSPQRGGTQLFEDLFVLPPSSVTPPARAIQPSNPFMEAESKFSLFYTKD